MKQLHDVFKEETSEKVTIIVAYAGAAAMYQRVIIH